MVVLNASPLGQFRVNADIISRFRSAFDLGSDLSPTGIALECLDPDIKGNRLLRPSSVQLR